MKSIMKLSFSLIRRLRREEGAIAVEFAIVFPILALLFFGIVDFGHAWYMRHLMSDACREGVRYGSRCRTNSSGTRVLPKNLTPSITNFILNTSTENGGKGGWGLTDALPSDASASVTLSGTGATETNPSIVAGENLTVTVNAQKTWFILGSIIPGFGNTVNMSVITTMTCE